MKIVSIVLIEIYGTMNIWIEVLFGIFSTISVSTYQG
jgi:hypothetical protein